MSVFLSYFTFIIIFVCLSCVQSNCELNVLIFFVNKLVINKFLADYDEDHDTQGRSIPIIIKSNGRNKRRLNDL